MASPSILDDSLNGRTLTIGLGERALGLPAALVREVAPVPRIARVPHAPEVVLGVANMRGTVVPVLSLARLLGLPDSPVQRIVVTEIDGPVGLAVTSVATLSIDVPHIDVAALIAHAIPERRQRRAAGSLASTETPTDAPIAQTDTIALVSFALAGQDFALPLQAIEEVLRLPETIARLPDAEAAVVGSIAARGAVLPLLSLAALLGLPVAPVTRAARIVVVRIGSHRVGMVVEAMRTIERVPASEIDPVPQALNRGGGEARIQAICRMDGGTRLLSVLAPDQLLRDDFTARLLQSEPGDHPDMTGNAPQGPQVAADDDRFVLFRIGEERFGLPIAAVREVAALPPRLTPLPKAPDFVLGVMTVRGQVIPVIDQAQRFHGGTTTSARPRVIVVEIGALTAGFLVDAVSEVVRLPAAALRPAPDLGGDSTRMFDRVASLEGEDGLVLIVSPQDLLDRAERDLLARLGRKGAKSTA